MMRMQRLLGKRGLVLQRAKDVVVVTIGTGVGGGILMNGKILLGASGFAGELGHIPVQYEGNVHLRKSGMS